MDSLTRAEGIEYLRDQNDEYIERAREVFAEHFKGISPTRWTSAGTWTEWWQRYSEWVCPEKEKDEEDYEYYEDYEY